MVINMLNQIKHEVSTLLFAEINSKDTVFTVDTKSPFAIKYLNQI